MIYVFGPVQSRRFGKSLGIDLSPSEKNCNFDCLYCELGSFKRSNNIKTKVDINKLLNELKSMLLIHKDCDYISVSANGEPTLCDELELIIEQINKIKTNEKTLILSNASTIINKNIQSILCKFDAVKLSLDSVIKSSFNKINRPLKDINLDDLIANLIDFSNTYKGELYLETLVLEGINDSSCEFIALNKAIKNMKITRFDIHTLDRPSDYLVKAVSFEKLKELATYIENKNINIVYRNNDLNKLDVNKDDLLKTISLRPLSVDELNDEVKSYAKELLDKDLISIVKINNIDFYKLKE